MADTSTKAAVTAGGKTLFEIEVRQTKIGTLFVMAESLDAAEADASEMAYEVRENEWDDVDTDWTVRTASAPPPLPSDVVWTGGPEGRNAKWPEISGG